MRSLSRRSLTAGGALVVAFDETDAERFPDVFLALLTAMESARHASAVLVNIPCISWNDVMLERVIVADNVVMSAQLDPYGRDDGQCADPLRTAQAAFPVSDDQGRWVHFPVAVFPSDGFLPYLRGVGFSTTLPDPDGVSRRVPLLVRYGDHVYASPSLLLARLALGRSDQPIRVDGGDVLLGEERVPLRRDYTLPVVFPRTRGAIERLSFRKFLDHPDSVSLVQDRILVFSDARPAKMLRVNTPTAPSVDNSEVLAQAALNIMDRRYATYLGGAVAGGRASHASTKWRSDAILSFAAALATALAIYLMALRLNPAVGGAVSLGLLLVAAVIAGALRARGWELPLLLPAFGALLGALAGGVTRFAVETAVRDHVRSIFARYLARNVLERVMSEPELMRMGGRRETLTVLFADIRRFTALAEGRPPDEVVRILNRFYAAMVEVVFRHEGTLDKLMGDAIMVFFGDPVRQPDHAARALRCAIEMQATMGRLEAELGPALGREFKVGIGINTGEVLVGNLGSEAYIDYTVIGDAVNLASRLEHAAVGGQILVGEETVKLLGESVQGLTALPPMAVRGKEQPVKAWEARS